MKKYLILLIILIALVGCESAEQKQAKLNQEKKQAAELKAKSEAEEKLKAEQAAKAKAEAEKVAAENKAKLSKVLQRFRKTTDKFNGKVTYTHKSYTPYFNTNGTTIMAEIQDNNIFCNSTYINDDWIFHTDFTVKTGDETSDYTGGSQHEVINGIAEAVNLNSSSSEALAKQIATADPKKPVMVRLRGKYQHDFNLRSTHRQAIKDTWELYQLLKI